MINSFAPESAVSMPAAPFVIAPVTNRVPPMASTMPEFETPLPRLPNP